MTLIGGVAAELGLSVEALRYYERAGLSAPTRDSAGRRVYSEFDTEQLRLVTGLRAVGVPVEAIRRLVAVKEPGNSRATAERAVRQLAEMQAVLRDRQAELTAALRLIGSWRAEIEHWLQHEPAT